MSNKAKKNAVTGAVSRVVLFGISLAAVALWHGQGPVATAQETPAQRQTLDAETYGQVQELRQHLGLEDAALAAVGCDREWAETVLSRLLTWCETNETTWTARRAAAAAARKALRAALRRLSVGSGGAELRSRLPQLRAAVATAKQQEEDLLAGLRQQIETGLTDSQKAVWVTIRANPASAGEYVYAPNITAAQLKALRAAHTRHARQHITADTGAARSAAATALARAERSILTDTQRTALAIARTNIRRHLPAVLAASQAILPRPAEPDDGLPGLEPALQRGLFTAEDAEGAEVLFWGEVIDQNRAASSGQSVLGRQVEPCCTCE